MKTPSRFWHVFWATISTPAAYYDLASRSLGKAVWYLSRVLFLGSVVIALGLGVAAYVFVPGLETHVSRLLQEIPTQYPAKLVITVQSGSLSINQKGPVHFDLGSTYRNFFNGKDAGSLWEAKRPLYLVTIDPKKTSDDYAKENSVALVTSKGVIVPDKDFGLRMIPYRGNVVINEKLVSEKFAKVRTAVPFVKRFLVVFVIGLLIVLPFLLTLGQLFIWMIFALICALLAWAVSAIASREWNYKELYKASLYGVTPVLLVRILFAWIPGFPPVPFWLLLIWMIVVILVSKPVAKTKSKKA